MLPWSAEFAGRIDEHVFSSELLRGNPLDDPHERPLWVYLPPGYDGEPDRHYPSVYVIRDTPATCPCGGTGPPTGSGVSLLGWAWQPPGR